ncbi:Ceramide kinase [Portunus trituberculatus]|uniref:Ceramide kinase n=1 Tax=Portunus trituberculatus TaxID=210409 RepID=A0A5B7DBM1_PORTR|nr:Ceramide kinase [Portunus trituberculatus]
MSLCKNTEHRAHAQELVEDEANLEGMDGVVAVGGDGLVNEVVMGLMLVACRREGINPHDPQVQLPNTPLRLGIIPGEAPQGTTAYRGCTLALTSDDI